MPRGALVWFRLECGHSVRCHACEPTPTECPQCAIEPHAAMPGQCLLPVDKKFTPLPETP